MSFAVIHMQKFKANALIGIQFHNQREREIKTNTDIDKSKTYLNYDLHNHSNIDFNKTVREKIKNNVITNRAIRKDAVMMCNFIVTSDKIFFDRLTDQEQKRFFKKSYEFFKNRYGEKNIVSANIHLDEKTPHMHLSLVPITKDNKLAAKRLFDRKELRLLQDDYPKYISNHGFDLKRGVDAEGKNKHIETQKFKALQIENKISQLEKQQNSLESDLNKIQEINISFSKIDSIEGKCGILNKSKITIDTKDFELLKLIGKKQHVLERKIEQLELDNKYMRRDIEQFSDSYNKINNKKFELQRDLIKSNDTIKDFSNQLNWFSNFLKQINQFDNALKYMDEKEKLLEKSREKQRDYDMER